MFYFQFLLYIVINYLKTISCLPNVIGNSGGADNRTNHKKYMYNHIFLLIKNTPIFQSPHSVGKQGHTLRQRFAIRHHRRLIANMPKG